MEIKEYRNIYKNEGSHFFYRASHDIIASLIDRYLERKKEASVLDAGCGTGLLAKKLETYGRVTAIDYSLEAIKFAKKRGVNVKKRTVTDTLFADNSFDLITCIDVIYHESIKNDLLALKEFFRILKPGGILILRVPAFNFLYSAHDKYVGTRNRYSKRDLMRKLKKIGFKIKKISYINMLLFFPALFKALLDKFNPKKNKSGVSTIVEPINSFLIFLLSLEIFLLKFINLPLGIGVIAVGEKHEKT